MVNIILIPISLIPVILLYLWLKKKCFSDEQHAKLAGKAFRLGLFMVLPVLGMGVVFMIIGRLFGLKGDESVAGAFYHNFFILALSEEVSKVLMLYWLVKKNKTDYSRMDIIIYWVCIAIGFDIFESTVYGLMTNAAQIIVRGVTLPHVGLGFVAGLIASLAIRKNNKMLFIPAFLLPWVWHGLYDFSLSGPASEANTILGNVMTIVALVLALFSLVTAIVFIVFAKKKRNMPEYTDFIIRGAVPSEADGLHQQ